MTEIELCTARAAGGVAVLALRGSGARERLARLGVARFPAPGNAPLLVRLCDGAEELDEALLVARGPNAFELHLHGSPPLVERALELLGPATPVTPGEPATPGEPGDASFRPDLGTGLTTRAWRAAARAPSELGARVLLDQSEGVLARGIDELCALAAAHDRRALAAAVAAFLERARVAAHLLRRTTVVLAGPVNAGKSTLFNLLLASERTLVSPREGTTRDAIAEEAALGPWPVLWVDTAGRRELPGPAPEAVDDGAPDPVEREGQLLAGEVAAGADWVLELRRAATRGDVDRGPGPAGPGDLVDPGGPGISTLWTACDELGRDPSAWPSDGLSVHARPAEALERVERAFRERFDLPPDPAAGLPPGAPVPFEHDLVDVLEQVARALRGGRAVEPLLERARALAR